MPNNRRASRTPDPRRQETGKANREEGKAFEKRIQDAFNYYSKNGAALIDKTPEPFTVTKRLGGGKFEAVSASNAQPDYKGILNGGRAVVYEAKFTSTDRILQNRVTDAQAVYLDRAAALGAWCFIIAGFSTGNVYKVPWEIWRIMDKYFNHKYANESDLKQYIVKLGLTGKLMLIPDSRLK